VRPLLHRISHERGLAGLEAVEVSERLADGFAEEEELERAVSVVLGCPSRADEVVRAVVGACTLPRYASAGWVGPAASWALQAGLRDDGGDSLALTRCRLRQCHLLRDIFGNPFRPPAIDPSWLTWSNGTVKHLARVAYKHRQLPSGHLDPGRLAVLADALTDAACTDTDLIGHLRDSGPHVRGCWAVDLLTNRE
jgi:hypothetical protein